MAENIGQTDRTRLEGNRRDENRRTGKRPNVNLGERKDDYPSKEIGQQNEKRGKGGEDAERQDRGVKQDVEFNERKMGDSD